MIDCVNCGNVFWFDDFMTNSIGIKCKCGNIDLSVHKNTLFEVLDKRLKRKAFIRERKVELIDAMRELSDQLVELYKYAV